MAKPNIKQLRDKIAARRKDRKAKKIDKYAKMRLVAAKAPEKLEKHLARLADKFASMAEGIENLRENLGLVRVGKEAPMKNRVAAAKSYGKKFVRIAQEAPEALEGALVEAYNGLNDIAADIEFAAEQMGVPLEAEGGMVQDVAEDIVDEAEFEGESPEHELMEKADGEKIEEEPEEDKEASGGDAFSTDRDESGQPKTPERVEVPRAASTKDAGWLSPNEDPFGKDWVGADQINEQESKKHDPFSRDTDMNLHRKKKHQQHEVEASGNDAWTTDRDKAADPATPSTMDIPQAQGESEQNKAAATSKKAMSRKDYILLADALRSFKMPPQQREDLARHLSKSLKQDNHAFNERYFVDYAMGVGGDRGGSKFKGDAPNNPDTLFV